MTENDKTNRLTELRHWLYSQGRDKIPFSVLSKIEKEVIVVLDTPTLEPWESYGTPVKQHPIELLIDLGAQVNLGNYVLTKDDDAWYSLTQINTGEKERALTPGNLMLRLLQKMEKRDGNSDTD